MRNMELTIHEDVQELLEELNQMGKTYIFGGYLRDRYFEFTPSDVDMVTNIPIEVIERKYAHMEKAKRRVTTSGHDVFSFKLHKREKIFIEIVCIDKDLNSKSKEADYTINSMLYDGKDILDSEGALAHFKEGVIKEVDIEIIKKDLKVRPFLWLKTLRLTSMTGFDLSKETFDALNENKECVKEISDEILQTEGHKTLNGKNPFKAIEILTEMGFIKPFVLKKEIKGKHAIQPQQLLCLFAILSNKKTIDDYVNFYRFQQDLVDKYEKLFEMYHSTERPPSRFRNQIITIKKIIEQ